ncbi:YeeE/YedE thiosulfate transporter family protein [Roseitranquillus sediminis]|uniref:YeeE/YedE thiosulfate transporter family protein n=1 Tax=Roseitranquillus sediminis TaxID=2809051 RepID=UPI001D0C6678|nr:YeeE/YedE thiosulfate transporter family protein [Roseitranquillus sediminis]MBM9595351.1 YeeE/YedE family protein [Roseitranquillus sediminis]
MFASFGFESLTAAQASVVLGLILGLAFGALAEVTRFCLRRAVAGERSERRTAAGVWLAALAAALVGTQVAVASGFIGFDEHRFMNAELPWLAIVGGGAMFGAGMILTRGCVSRMTVLLASGNLRALTVLLVFAVTAHATLKGTFASVRTAIGSVTLPLGEATSLAALPGGALFWSGLLAIAAAIFAVRSGVRPLHLGLAALLGLLVPAGWVGTGFLLYDDFDPIAFESLSFTSPTTEALFWSIASTSIPAGFGVGLLGGVILGAGALALASGRFTWQSFESPAQTGRYVAGAALMGVGGVLAGGCTVGAGLAGVPTLSVAALLALLSIVGGALLADRALNRTPQAAGVPAE